MKKNKYLLILFLSVTITSIAQGEDSLVVFQEVSIKNKFFELKMINLNDSICFDPYYNPKFVSWNPITLLRSKGELFAVEGKEKHPFDIDSTEYFDLERINHRIQAVEIINFGGSFIISFELLPLGYDQVSHLNRYFIDFQHGLVAVKSSGFLFLREDKFTEFTFLKSY